MYYLSAFGSFDCMWVLSGQIRIEEHNKAKSSIMISYLINLRVYYILYLYPSWPFRQFKCSFHIFQSFVNSKIHTGHFYYLPKFLVWSPFSSMRPHFHAGGADCQDGVILSSCHADCTGHREFLKTNRYMFLCCVWRKLQWLLSYDKTYFKYDTACIWKVWKATTACRGPVSRWTQ